MSIISGTKVFHQTDLGAKAVNFFIKHYAEY